MAVLLFGQDVQATLGLLLKFDTIKRHGLDEPIR